MVALLICAILGILMGSYLQLVNASHFSIARSQAWNRAITVAEGGVEEAMAHLNSGVDVESLGVNSWTGLGEKMYSKRSVLAEGYADVTIIATNSLNPLIVSRGVVGGALSAPSVARTVAVRAAPKTVGGVPGAMIVTTTVNFSGFNVRSDSFDSSDPNYSTDGRYDPLKAKDNGDISTTSGTINDMSLGNAKIKGKVHTGPASQPEIGSNGSVGDKNYVDSGQLGVQEGHFVDDMIATFPDAVLPDQLWMPPVPGTHKIAGHNYKYVLDKSGGYILDRILDSIYVSAKDVVLYVTTDIKISSRDVITIAPGASLTIYMAGPNTTFSGGGIVNLTGQAENCRYYGLPLNTLVDISSNADFVGTIYAPQAAFQLGGGGKTEYDFIGKSISKSAKMNGNFNFHYDEKINAGLQVSGYAAKSWTEL